MKKLQKSIFLLAIGSLFTTSAYSLNNFSNFQNGGQRGAPPSVDKIFAELDTDGDGLLSKTEVKGPLADQFETIDSDNDGFISKTELENAPKPERGQRPRK